MVDMRTVIFSYAISNAICVIVMALLWLRNRRRFEGLGFWLADFAMQFAGVLLVALRGVLPDFASVVAANAFIIGGTILLLMGLERFAGKRTSHVHNYILLVAFILVHSYFTFIQPSLPARNINLSAGLILVCSQCAWLLIRGVDADLRPVTRGVGYIFLTFCVAAAARIILDLVVDQGNDLFASGVFDTLAVLVYQMLFIILSFGLILMLNRRLIANLEQDIIERQQADAALKLSEEKYSNIFHSSPDAIAITRLSDGKLVEVNEGFSRLLGYSQEEALSSSSINLGLWATLKEREALVAELQEKHSLRDREYNFRTKSGRILNCLYSGEVIELGGEAHALSVVRDITELKQAEGELRKLSRVVEQSQVSVIITDTSGAIEYVNPKFSELTGYSFDEVRGKNPRILRSVGASPEVYKDLWKTITEGREWHGEFHNQKKSGELFWESTIISPIVNERGVITHFVAVKEDITERKWMDESLRYQNNILAALNQVMLDLVNRHEVDDMLQALLVKIGDLLEAPQISVDLIENNDVLVTYAAASGQPLQKGDRMRRGEGGWLSWQAIDTGRPAILEDYSNWPQRRQLFEGYPIHAIMIIPIQHRDHVIGAINISRSEANMPFNETDIYVAQQLAQMVALVLDNAQLYTQLHAELAERIRSEEALHEAHAELVAQQRTVAVFEERQRLARDLHDSVNQSIHSLVLFSETLASILEKNRPERAKQIADRLQESARQALKETRLMLYELQPSAPGRSVDLIQDLETRLATVERHAGVKAQIIQEGSLDHCPREWHENLFWITIEALNNALKHAQARKVQIMIRCSSQRIELEILDNGKGFELNKPRGGGLGLRNMRERANILGGEVMIDSSPGGNTCVRFSAEIKEKP